MALEAAFIFLAPGADSGKHRTVVETPAVNLRVVGVRNYEDAVQVAGELAAQGVGAIELCGGFGIEGTAAVKRAVQGKAVIGVVRFDNHPGIEFKSGDELF
jgi:hypothetical protein